MNQSSVSRTAHLPLKNTLSLIRETKAFIRTQQNNQSKDKVREGLNKVVEFFLMVWLRMGVKFFF